MRFISLSTHLSLACFVVYFMGVIIDIPPDGNFEGFDCHWNEIPSSYEETVAILVKASNANIITEQEIYTAVSKIIFDIYGQEPRIHHPIRDENLPLDMELQKIGSKPAVQSKWKLIHQLKLGGMELRKKWFREHNREKEAEPVDWGAHRQMLIANSDYRKLDEVLRMILSGTAVQRQQLRHFLEKWRQDGKLVYGVHANKNALVTCLVSDHNANHVHFLDGSNGGYTLAAKEMKTQLKSKNGSL